MRDSDDPTRAYPPGVETVTVADVTVPVACRDRIDGVALATAADVLASHDIVHYQVSPVGGLKVYVGIHRPDADYASVRRALADIGYGLHERGASRGFRRLRVTLVPPDEE